MNPYLPILLIVAAFSAGILAVLAVGMIVLGRRSTAEKIERRIGLEDATAGEAPAEILARDADGWFDRYFYQLLAESGLSISPLAVLMLMVGVAAVVGGIALVWTESMGGVVAAALVGFWPPLLWIRWVRGRRIRAMENLMPGVLDQLADCLHSGQTLEQAAESVSLQAASPLKEEFGHCLQLLKMGQSPVAVMDRLSRRIPLPEFRLFATAVLVHRQTGGNLSQLTSRLAVSARDRQEWRRHLGAQTVAGRYSALGLVACGIIGLGVLSASHPEYTGFFLTHPRGPTFLAVAVVLVIIGTIWISRVIRIDY
ncbi:MAG: type II secretion system F family protein [Planctomycetota bacterium]